MLGFDKFIRKGDSFNIIEVGVLVYFGEMMLNDSTGEKIIPKIVEVKDWLIIPKSIG